MAIKRFKMNEGDSVRIFKVLLIYLAHYHYSACTQRLCREVIGWKHLSHPNVFPLLGISMSVDPYPFLILSEWMGNGNAMQYAKSNPKANRLQLVGPFFIPCGLPPVHSCSFALRCHVWRGLPHELRIVHGGLKGVSPVSLAPYYPADW